MTPPQLTIVVPTYNERTRIEELVKEVFAAARSRGLVLEMVIVDDNSPDGTGDVADALAQQYRVKVVHRANKLGLGTGVVAGFGVAEGEIVGAMDADFSHPPAMVPELYEALIRTKADMVIGSRYVPGGSASNWTGSRRFLSRLACVLTRGLTPVRDAMSGFFMMRRDAALNTVVKAAGFKIGLELIARSGAKRVVEVPYRFDDRESGESKMSTGEGMGFLVQLADLYWRRVTTGHPAKPQYEQVPTSSLRSGKS